NKCLNEKRRRNQENLFIDELAELVSATDMSSGKTDKCQILQRAVDQNQQSENGKIVHCQVTRRGEEELEKNLNSILRQIMSQIYLLIRLAR
ncbi:unnamed protein product, partial [Heterotrigona itama]